MHRLSTSFILGYHGCPEDVAERILAGEHFTKSDNDYDWLGPGIYFWQANPARAVQFANEKAKRERATWRPSVVGAVIELGLCLDLTTEMGIAEVQAAHAALESILVASGGERPVNSKRLPRLDCAVIRALHQIRKDNNEPPVDTVLGIFVEGGPIYPTSNFHEKTHVQVCVCDPNRIKGAFRVTPEEWNV